MGERDPVVPTAGRERRNRRAVTTLGGGARMRPGGGLDGGFAARLYDTYQAGRVDATEIQSIEVN
jgi:hypothetical protein